MKAIKASGQASLLNEQVFNKTLAHLVMLMLYGSSYNYMLSSTCYRIALKADNGLYWHRCQGADFLLRVISPSPLPHNV